MNAEPTRSFFANPSRLIGKKVDEQMHITAPVVSWVSQNTAILVIHGIGEQNPTATLNDFATTLVGSYNKLLKTTLTISHEVDLKDNTDRGTAWFDNYLSLAYNGNENKIDIYEYYWAYQTEDKATPSKVQSWVNNVVKEARKFYAANMKMNDDFSSRKFFRKRLFKSNKGKYKFRHLKYKILLFIITQIVPIARSFSKLVKWILEKIPFLKYTALLEKPIAWLQDKIDNVLVNWAGDLVIYNSADEKSSLFNIRCKIREGAVDAIRYFIDKQKNENGEEVRKYDRVIIAGHSLGTQIGYDAINRLNTLINEEQISGIRKDGIIIDEGTDRERPVSKLLTGLLTFGSPLDKIAFFLREQVSKNRLLMLQVLIDYHCFRQRNWYTTIQIPPAMKVSDPFNRLFEEITWYNYFDKKDPVSGSLDFYDKVNNVDCNFTKDWNFIRRLFAFTHSRYWSYDPMFEEFITNYLQ